MLMGMSSFELKRIVLLAFPVPILLVFPAAFAFRGLWVPALACSLGAAVYIVLIWRWQRVREADEALARAALHDAAGAEEKEVHVQTAPSTASGPAQGPPAESSPRRPAP
ncbi:hypothetical protein AB0O16_04235 [Microbacterium sp. NPDC089180]|uniref:hypothetical protein n=2 Tax=Microbacterium TaxID=33882 RepID=UPI003419B44A